MTVNPKTTMSPTPVPITEEEMPRRPNFAQRFSQNRSGMVGLVLVSFFVLVSLIGAVGLTPHLPLQQHPIDRLQPPSQQYPLGTDLFGRDVASRVMKGGTNSLRVALFSVSLATFAGTLLGITAGFVGGRVDNFIMRLMDVFFAFPGLLLSLLVVVVLGPSLNNTIIAISIVYTPIFARVARGPVLFLKEMEFVTAARCLGVREANILLLHVLPNAMAPLIVQVTLALSWALITEAGLSFLGLGTQPPEPSWGLMLSESRSLAEMAPWLMVAPGLAIMLSVLGFNLLGDGIRDTLDPRFIQN